MQEQIDAEAYLAEKIRGAAIIGELLRHKHDNTSRGIGSQRLGHQKSVHKRAHGDDHTGYEMLFRKSVDLIVKRSVKATERERWKLASIEPAVIRLHRRKPQPEYQSRQNTRGNNKSLLRL